MTDLVANQLVLKCWQKECVRAAVERIRWPDREPLPVCAEHAAQAREAAGAIGLTILIERL